MSESFKGEMATCACGTVGGIVDGSGLESVRDPWWVIEHDNGEQHINVRVRVDGKFRFKLKE
jgi:hypothetical protein